MKIIDRRLANLARDAVGPTSIVIVLGTATGVLTILQALVISRIAAGFFIHVQPVEALSGGFVQLLGLYLAQAACQWGGDYAAGKAAVQVKANLRTRLLHRLLTAGAGYVKEERTGELVSTALEGVETLDAYFRSYLPQFLLAVLVPVIFLFVVFPKDLLTGTVFALTAPLIPLFMVLIGNLTSERTQRQWKTLSRMSAHFLDVLQGLPTLKTLGRSQSQTRVITRVSERYGETTLGVLRVAFLSAFTLELAATLSTAVIAVQIGLRLLYGRMEFETALFILVLAPAFYQPLRALGASFHAGAVGEAAADRIFKILDELRPQENYGAPQPIPPGDIHFDRVGFTYPDGRTGIVDADLKLPAGKTTALVGHSGSGKTTLTHLLLRFLTPVSGSIQVGETPLDTIPLETWLDHVAWVPQQPFLFNDTVAANLRLGRPSASQSELETAARQAHLHDFIISLPEGYATVIGERGARLSSGQAQRLALARAFLKNAPLVILDEPAAHLDPETSQQIQESISHLLAGRTALVIAHHLDTLRRADQVVILEEGRVQECGIPPTITACPKKAAVRANALGSNRLVGGNPEVPSHPLTTASLPLIRPTTESTRMDHHATIPANPHPAHPFKTLLSFVAPFKRLLFLAGLLGFATIGSSVGLMGTAAYIISAAALGPSIALLQVPIVGVRFFGISRAVFRYLERLVSHRLTFRLLAQIRTWFYQHLEPLAPARMQEIDSGDLLARIMGDVTVLERFYLRVLAPPLVAALVGLSSGWLLWYFHPKLTLVFAIFYLLAGLVLPWLTALWAAVPGAHLVTNRAALSQLLVDGVQGLADLRAFNRVQFYLQKIRGSQQDLSQVQLHLTAITGGMAAAVQLFANLGVWSVLLVCGALVYTAQVDGVYLAALALVTLAAYEAVMPLPEAFQGLAETRQAASRLLEVVQASPAVVDPTQPAQLPDAFDLQVKNVSFGYAAQSPVLSNLTFQLLPGKRVALVGLSGSGKTTLVNLLLRFWDYSEGKIMVGGTDLRALPQEQARALFALVSQNTHLFNASLRENLLLGNPGASKDDLLEAIQKAQLGILVKGLPEGLDTWLGEQGAKLSGGERQRVALARALLKDAPILILDEPTAHLDPTTEGRVLQTILQASTGKSLLLITHRLTGMEAMDEILVLDQGCLVERGSHAELLVQGGRYARMWAAWLGVLE